MTLGGGYDIDFMRFEVDSCGATARRACRATEITFCAAWERGCRVETGFQRHSDQLPPASARRRHPLIAVLHAVRNTTTTQQHTTT